MIETRLYDYESQEVNDEEPQDGTEDKNLKKSNTLQRMERSDDQNTPDNEEEEENIVYSKHVKTIESFECFDLL